MIDKILGARELLQSLGYKVEGLSHILYDNKGMVIVAYNLNMTIKKRSTALAFHRIHEAIAAGAIELQHISRDINWANFLIKSVNNTKFIACTKGLIIPYVKATNV